MLKFNEELQFLRVHLCEVAQALHKGDRALIAMPATPLTVEEDADLLSRLVWIRLRICQPYKLTDQFRMFEKL
jgi:hypothetical protein